MGVPLEWTRLMEHQRIARMEEDAMKSAAPGSAAHDLAMRNYMRSVDVVMACLGTLSETQTLGRITMFLATKVRS